MKYSLPRLEDRGPETPLFGFDDSPTDEISDTPVPKIDRSMDAYEGINSLEPDQPLDEIQKLFSTKPNSW